MMTAFSIPQFLALICLVPALLLGGRQAKGQDVFVLTSFLIAATGPLAWTVFSLQSGWRVDFAFTLWTSASVMLLTFFFLSLVFPTARRLGILVFAYAAFMLIFATVFHGNSLVMTEAPDGWLILHIGIAVVTYSLITLASLAGLALFMKERVLKKRLPEGITIGFPAITESDRLLGGLLLAGEVILFAGGITGIAIQVTRDYPLMEIDHKTLLSLAAFCVIGMVLVLQYRTGLRGRAVAQIVLIGYLLVTLAWPGVKFVTDILMG